MLIPSSHLATCFLLHKNVHECLLLLIMKNWKYLKSSFTVEWIGKLCFIHRMNTVQQSFSTSTLDILDYFILFGGLFLALENVWQHSWPLPTGCLQQLPSYDNQNCLQILTNVLGEQIALENQNE